MTDIPTNHSAPLSDVRNLPPMSLFYLQKNIDIKKCIFLPHQALQPFERFEGGRKSAAKKYYSSKNTVILLRFLYQISTIEFI